jgi:replicative DNA helicase
VRRVTVAEIQPRGGDEFERTPPHDLAAEQCVLGGMLLSKDAISDVLEVIKGSDFYRPAHQIVHEVILDLYGRGEPADAVTVAAELTRRGDIGRMGGAPYLHTLIASVPTAANAGYYARIVRERAILRRLVEVGTRIVQLGYSGDGDADELVDRAEAEVYGVTDHRVSEDYAPLSEIMPGALDEIEAIGSRGGSLTGVPTGFADLDALTNGLHPGQMVVIAARPAIGKALALDTPLPTPAGWTTMGEVQVGDCLLGADGQPTRVVAATEVMTGRPCFEVEFSDGTVIVADAGHQWRTTTRASRRQYAQARSSWARGRKAHAARVPAYASRPVRPGGTVSVKDYPGSMAAAPGCGGVVTTAQLARTLRASGDGRLNHVVALARPAELPHQDLPVLPYALGARLGDEASGTGAERIPALYLRASQAQRRALLAGLLDAAGSVTESGTVQLAVTSWRLAEDAQELALSLGYRATMTSSSALRFVVTFAPDDQVLELSRKLDRPARGAAGSPGRLVTAARPVASVPVRCVQVDNGDHMYLAGRTWIPTHNSTLALDLARAAAIHAGMTTVIFSLEMSRNEITMRLLSAEARVALHHMRTGGLGDEDWTRLARRMSEVADSPLFIDDSPNMSMMEIRAKCRRLKQRNDLKLVIIDYLQLMSSPKRVENRQQEVSELSRSLKLLAKELGVPVVALSQLNRGPEQRTDKRPMLSDLRESGSIEQDSDMVILLHREDAYERESPRAGEADFIVAKHRNGPTATVTVAFQGHYSRFVDMAPI